MSKPWVGIVDAFSTGRLLAEAWSASHRLIHINSLQNPPEVFQNSVPVELFEENLYLSDGLDAVLEKLRLFAPIAIVCGSEFGVETADTLAFRMGLTGNPPDTSQARRDKYKMARLLEERNQPGVFQFSCADVEAAAQAHQSLGGGRVVVKPLTSAGSEDVYICSSVEDVERRVEAILGRKNLMQQVNSRALVQEYLEGPEFVVNSVSADGQHFITDIWRCNKSIGGQGRLIYNTEELLSPGRDSLTARISEYLYSVLDALDIRFGPAHSEIILTKNGFRLVEAGARLSGLANPRALNLATGRNQTDLSKLVYLEPNKIKELSARPYDFKKHALCVNLISPGPGLLDVEGFRREIEKLDSFESLRLRTTDGRVRETTDLNSSPGVVFLVLEDGERLRADAEELRNLEAGFYSSLIAH